MHLDYTKRLAHPGWIEIDLDQFAKNIKALKAYVPKQKICLTVKANAYGHGLVPIAQTAVKHGIEYLAVAHLQEGAMLREAGITAPILVLGAIHEDQLADLLHYNLEFSISSHYKAELVANICKNSQQKAHIHLEIETGMQRTGMRPETALDLINKLADFTCFELKGIYSHLANGDTPNDPFSYQQIALFRDFTAEVR
jgi:alanine racemase